MVLGSSSLLTKAEQKKLQLQLHHNRQNSRVKDADGFQQRRKKVLLLKTVKELRQTAAKARELGLRTEEVTRLRKVFNGVDGDQSEEINLEELHQLCQTIQNGRLSHLTKWELQQFMDENDNDQSGTLGFSK